MWRTAGYSGNQRCSPPGSTRISPVLASLIALTLAVLNPLACLIHCAVIDARAHRAQAQHAAADAAALYLCDLLRLGQSDAVMSTAPISTLPPAAGILPRAFYEGTVPAVIGLPLLILVTALLAPLDSRRTSRNTPPPYPPPRTA
jgi:hypothetical protein